MMAATDPIDDKSCLCKCSNDLFAAAALLISAPAFAQVPPDIAAGIRKIGPIVDTPNTGKLYAPLFKDVKEPYSGVKVVRDITYGPDPLNRMDVFTPEGAQAGG